MVRTVLGDLSPRSLGHTQPHEHLLCDLSTLISHERPDAEALGALSSGRDVALERGRQHASRPSAADPIRLDNYDWIKRNVLNRDNLQMLSEQDAIDEMHEYRTAGGCVLVESTPVGMGRNPEGYARISKATGVHVVMGSGYYVRECHPPELDEASCEEIRDEILQDIVIGVGDSGVRSGLIGEIGLSWPMHPVEEKVLRAACAAQVASGAPLQLHPGRTPQAPIEAMRRVIEAGGIPERTIMSHVDRTLFDIPDMLELARTGCYLEFDLFGQESSYYVWNPEAKRPNDATRIEWIKSLMEAGYGRNLLVSQDICQKVYQRRYGGPGYVHILENVLPLMRRCGLSAEDTRLLTEENPLRILTLTG